MRALFRAVGRLSPKANRGRVAAIAALAIGVACGGDTPERAAGRLVHGPWRSDSDVTRAQAYGDRLLGPLRTASKDFSAIDIGHEIDVAEVLSANRSPLCEALLIELSRRREFAPRLIAALGLLRHGKQLDEETRVFLRRVASADLSPDERLRAETADGALEEASANALWAYRALAMRALGEGKDAAALSVLVASLNDVPQMQTAACNSLALMRDSRAVPALRGAIRDPQFEPAVAAFRALIALGDHEAVGLAIERIDPAVERYTGGALVPELEAVTGEKFGLDKTGWTEWWKVAGPNWRLPPSGPR